ncbi:MAG: hypothetical protein IKZ58_04115 [Selenomonadaceae bacterium]|nr:hypothetical protein [Selenomonadaceae bacterium]
MGTIERSITILTILLKKYRPMSYQEIQRELFNNYGEEIDWRTIKVHVDALSKIFDIIRRDKNGRPYVKSGFGGKTIQSVIKLSLVKSNENENKMAA